MKTVRDIENASLSDDLQSSSMGMVLNATSFNHIISNLYKNPLGAVIRELTTNALESHIVANTNKRVAIQLPTALDQEFVIRDFGTGLTHDEVEKYLNSLFSSSKDGNDDFMGGFGLGSKSPLALVDTFNLVSICQGKKNVYAWIKEGGKLPSLVRMGDEDDFDEPTMEESGIKIVIPLGSSSKLEVTDLEKTCQLEARKQLFGFTKDRIMLTDNIHTELYSDLNDITDNILLEKVLLDLPTLTVFERSAVNHAGKYVEAISQQYILIGGVAYPLNDYAFSELFNTIMQRFKNTAQYVFAIKAPIGKLDIPMSREEILTTSNNKTIVKDLLSQSLAEVIDYIQKLNINLDCDLVEYYNQLSTIASSNINKNSKVEFNLDISDATFEKHEEALCKPFKGTYNQLKYSNLNKETLIDHILMKLENLEQSYKVFKYNLDLSIRDRVSDSWSHRNQFKLKETDWSFVAISSPLPPGVSTKDFEKYIEEELKPQHRVILIQTPDHCKQATLRLLEIAKVWQQANQDKNKTTSLEVLGYVEGDDVKEFRKNTRAALRSTGVVTRSTYDFVPGFRLTNGVDTATYMREGVLCLSETDTKVYKLIDAKGKTISVGPEYLDATQKTKKIMLLSDERLPVDLTAFKRDSTLPISRSNINLNADTLGFKQLFSDFVVMRVQAKSFDGALKRLQDAKYDVYHANNLYTLNKLELEKADTVTKEKILFPYLTKYTRREYLNNYYYPSSKLKVFFNGMLLNAVQNLPDSFYKDTWVEVLTKGKSSSDLLDNTGTSSLECLYNVSEKDMMKLASEIDEPLSECLLQSSFLKENIVSVVKSDLLTDKLLSKYFESALK